MGSVRMFFFDIFPNFVLTLLVYVYNFQLADFTYLKANPLTFWEIVAIYAVVFFFIFKNVIPKFVTFGGARRHYNDVRNVEKKGLKKFMTKNYIRLFMHILSGATQVLTSGAYVLAPHYFNTIFSFTFLQGWFIFWDTIHQATGWLMTRNHDGIFAIRAFNLAFMVVKLFFCGQIYQMTSMNEDFITLVGGIFILTSGFAWVRFTCSVISIAQVVFLNIDFTALRENWYSWGLWMGQFLIAWRCQVLGHMHLVFAFASIYFPIELWIKKNAHHKTANVCACWFIAAFYYAGIESQIIASLGYLVYSYYFSGKYWKRAPIPGVDYNEKMDKSTQKKFNLRRSVSVHRYAFKFIADLVGSRSPSVVAPKVFTVTNETGDIHEPELSKSVSFSRSSYARKKGEKINQARLAKMITSAMASECSAAQMAAQIANSVQNGNLAVSPIPMSIHPMAMGIDWDEEGEDERVAATLSPLISRTPSTRFHAHY